MYNIILNKTFINLNKMGDTQSSAHDNVHLFLMKNTK